MRKGALKHSVTIVKRTARMNLEAPLPPPSNLLPWLLQLSLSLRFFSSLVHLNLIYTFF